jgi:hypothetical protein
MAIVVESVSTNAMGTGGVLTKPTGLAVGDTMIAILASQAPADLAAPGGWSTVTSLDTPTYTKSRVFSKTASAGDVAASNFTFTGTDIKGGILYRISGAALSLINVGTGTPPGAESLVIIWGIAGDNDGTSTSFGGYAVTGGATPTFTERLDSSQSTGGSTSLGVADGVYSSAAAITAYSLSVGGGMDESTFTGLFIPALANATGTNVLLSVSPAIFTNAGVEVGGTGANTLLDVSPAMFDQSGRGDQRTVWVNEPKPSTTWVNDPL